MPGTVIRYYREMRNYSQKYVASKMGISQNAYSKIENNVTQLTVHHVKQLSAILEVPFIDLLKDDFEFHKPLNPTGAVQRDDLIRVLEQIKQKLDNQTTVQHDCYPISFSLLASVNTLVSHIN